MESSVLVLTGAGISAESGLQTFRDSGGLWEGERVEDVATPMAFARNPQRVLKFYNMRRNAVSSAEPNAAHYSLADMQKHCGSSFTIITQNVDDLHERAGSTGIIHMHGSIFRSFCIFCNTHIEQYNDMHRSTPCPSCKRISSLRPDIVWFGEMPQQMERIAELLSACTLFLSIGTSGTVYPAAQFVVEARNAGAHTVILNKEHIHSGSYFHEEHYGDAGKIVPRWVKSFLAKQ